MILFFQLIKNDNFKEIMSASLGSHKVEKVHFKDYSLLYYGGKIILYLF